MKHEQLLCQEVLLVYSCFVSFPSHYFVHGGWFKEENHLLNRVEAIRHIPATIVQGRYDVVTPMKTAWELHKVGDTYHQYRAL